MDNIIILSLLFLTGITGFAVGGLIIGAVLRKS